MDKELAIEVNEVRKNFHAVQHRRSIKQLFTTLLIQPPKQSPQRVLKGISLEIKKGEFFGVVGRNGSGKSTLLKILAGIYHPNKGSVRVNGQLVPFIELGVGFNPELSGEDNVFLNGALLGYSRKQIRTKYDKIVEFAELSSSMDQKLKNFSSGMQVRLAFSIATQLADSDILLLDEVLAVGDAAFQQKCYGYFKELKRQKKTVVFVSHDMATVKEYCDRAALIEGGKIKMIGSVQRVANEYLSLFMNDKHAISPTGNTGKRWGLGDVKITDKKLSFNNNSELSISLQLKTVRKVEDCVVGFSVHEEGMEQILFGTNSEYLGIKIPQTESGEYFRVSFKIPNILRQGKYSIGLAVHGKSGFPVYDWWDLAFLFSVNDKRRSPYPVTPLITAKIESN